MHKFRERRLFYVSSDKMIQRGVFSFAVQAENV